MNTQDVNGIGAGISVHISQNGHHHHSPVHDGTEARPSSFEIGRAFRSRYGKTTISNGPTFNELQPLHETVGESAEGWYGSHVLSSAGWSIDKVNFLLDLAANYKNCLEKKVGVTSRTKAMCLNLFCEPSTRTRLSFERAAHHLGIRVLSASDMPNDSIARDGESLEDMGRFLSAYADVLVLRHPDLGAAKRLALATSVPVINAGDGAGEHPTQALVDVFTIREGFGTLKGLRVGLCGDLRNDRAIHSLLRLLVAYGCEITAISPEGLQIRPEVLQEIPGGVGAIRFETDLSAVLSDLDVLYMTRVQHERFHDIDVYEHVRRSYQLTKDDLRHASDHLQILHPQPRIHEIAVDVDADARAFDFIQASNGVPVRMALLSTVLGLQNCIYAGA